jgi:hypothetical protein
MVWFESGVSSTEDYEEDPNADIQTSPLERAQTLFAALDIDLDGTLTLDDFVRGYMERSVLMTKQAIYNH